MGLTFLASFPKSGSTWVRAFLAAYIRRLEGADSFDIADVPLSSESDSRLKRFAEVLAKPASELTEAEIDAARAEVQRRLAKQVGDKRVIKTHNARVRHAGTPLIDRQATSRVVYVVRNPLDVVDSLADHANLSLDGAITLMANRQHQLKRNDSMVTQYLDSWSEHVKSWTMHRAFPVLVVRYEDLKHLPQERFSELIRFLGWEFSEEHVRWAIEQTAFDRLSSQEVQNGFAEVSGVAKTGRFFRKGVSDRWREILTPAQAIHVVQTHQAMMRQAGYGEVVDEVLADGTDTVHLQSQGDQNVNETALPAIENRAVADDKPASAQYPKANAKATHAKSFVPADWKRWIAENLLRGSRPEDLVGVMTSKGYPRELSQLEVDVANSHPYVMAARSVITKT